MSILYEIDVKKVLYIFSGGNRSTLYYPCQDAVSLIIFSFQYIEISGAKDNIINKSVCEILPAAF